MLNYKKCFSGMNLFNIYWQDYENYVYEIFNFKIKLKNKHHKINVF